MKRYRVGRARHIDGSESGPSLIWENTRDDGNGQQIIAKTLGESLAVELVRRANAYDELRAANAEVLRCMVRLMEHGELPHDSSPADLYTLAFELDAKHGRTE